MNNVFFFAFALAFFLSFLLTFFVSRFAVKRNIVDAPDSERRFHDQPTPTLGGLAIYISFFIATVSVGFWLGNLLNGNIPIKILTSIFAGGFILMVGGYLDDKYRLPPRYSVIFPVLASLVIVSSGISAVSVHNPLTGKVVYLDDVLIYGMPILSGLIVFSWTMLMTYTTKLLDGMDGLVTGITAIGALVLFALSLSSQVMQEQTAFLAITFCGSLLGFLILNSYPAKIFLGEGGSTFAGFMLAVLAIVSGGKIATAVLVMGIPLLDAIWVVLQRIFNRQSPFSGDRKHLHFRLTEIGFSPSQAVLFLYAITGLFGASALFLQSMGKLIAFLLMVVFMMVLVVGLFVAYNFRQKNRNNQAELEEPKHE